MRKVIIGLLVAGSVLTVGMAPVGVKVLADTTAAMPGGMAGMGEGGARRGPLANFMRGLAGRFITLRSELDLTDAQKDQLKAIVKSHKSEIVAAIKPVIEKRRALHDAVLAEKTDEKAIRAAADDLGHAVGNLSVLAAKIKGEAVVVLTADQRQKLTDFRQQVERSVDEMLQKMGDEPK